jgi:D-alanyl-D-alanine dipeptidase
MKPYQQTPISDCGEPLVPIPLDQFAVEQPHPYVKVSAPYDDKSPYYLRQGVLERLMQAQELLQQIRPHWRIQIFDAYRPIAVQQYMVDYSFAQLVAAQGLSPEQLTASQRQTFWEQVYQFWAVPNLDPATPPPHSTGAAVDVTLVDARGTVVDMGSPIDEMSPRSHPNYFAPDGFADPFTDAHESRAKGDEIEKRTEGDRLVFHGHRQLLKQVMESAGFRQHPKEWWHFSFGDQLWAWLAQQDQPTLKLIARYGSV